MKYLLLTTTLLLLAHATEYRSLGDEFIDFNPPKKSTKYHGDEIEFYSYGDEFGKLKVKKKDIAELSRESRDGEMSKEQPGMEIEVDIEQKSEY